MTTGYGKRPFSPPPSPDLTLELGDALYSLCQLATSVGVDLDTALALALEKYQRRQQAGETGD